LGIIVEFAGGFLRVGFIGGAGEEWQGPFPAEAEEAEEQVYDLEDGDGAHAVVEVGGEEVPE